ncbi:uncharacterized protein COL516b_011007 [Neofusicoccum parvum]|uniref:Uncharacterized protein COL516b_011007 n=1 Tax=Neofusicoccum parvum TaxID=310453 RepID=A0ACB5SCK3_9PEZI|nr:uncharacterized protein COL516b_011007 [Neofusicoccum parvum]
MLPFASTQDTLLAPIEEVWAFVAAIGTEKIYIPGAIKSALLEGSGAGALRKVTLQQGVVYERILVHDTTTHCLVYMIEDGTLVGVKGVIGVVQLISDSGDTGISWKSYINSQGPVDEEMRKFASNLYQGAIAGIRKLVEE